MASTLSLAWNAHENNICNGLRLLQQHGEFVDMTLAADGHHVKVHQLVLSLASPYIKELITSAPSSHPIIFLNNISYNTLSAILEYVYTGEVHIPKDSLSELLQAAKALHIKGLKELKTAKDQESKMDSKNAFKYEGRKRMESVIKSNVISVNDMCNKQSMELDESEDIMYTRPEDSMPEETVAFEYVSMPVVDAKTVPDDEIVALETEIVSRKVEPSPLSKISGNMSGNKPEENYNPANVQYSISNQGNLQIIFNRYVYNLKYVQKNLNKYWRCVDYGYKKCPANIYTNNKNKVIKRRSDHNHPFHDQKIIKKLHSKVVFGAFNEAEDRILNQNDEEDELKQPSLTEEENISE